MQCDTTSRYINKPTQLLVEAIAKKIQDTPQYRDNDNIQNAFKAYQKACQTPPAIVEYVKRHTDPNSPDAGFTKEQLELLMAAMIFRAAPTYGAITRVSADLSDLVSHEEARIINRNVMEEIGTDTESPHPHLLYQSMYHLGEALGCKAPSRISYRMARHLLDMRKLPEFSPEFGHNTVEDFPRLENYMREQENLLPKYALQQAGAGRDISPYRLPVAAHICDLVPPNIAEYQEAVSNITQCQTKPSTLKQTNIRRVAIGLMEMATREASSVDEFDNGNLSYIGAWDKVVRSYQGYMEPYQRPGALAWSKAHGDEHEGRKAGWDDSREEGHAADAREITLKILSYLSPEMLVETLQDVTHLTQMRNQLWEDVVKRMDDLVKISEENPHIPLKPTPEKHRFPKLSKPSSTNKQR